MICISYMHMSYATDVAMIDIPCIFLWAMCSERFLFKNPKYGSTEICKVFELCYCYVIVNVMFTIMFNITFVFLLAFYVYVKLSSFISVYNRVRSDYTKEPLRYDEKLAIENMFMVTSSNGIEIFSALPALCMGNSPVTGEFPAQRPVTRSFDVFFDLRLNKRLSKQSWGWWFVTPSRSLWRHCNAEGSTSRHKNWNAMDDNILAADEILK